MGASDLVAASPADAGVDAKKLEALFARVRRDVDEGRLPSAQVAVARHGRLAGMRTFGSAVQGGEEKAATDDTLYVIFSSTKAIVASAVWTLFEEGKLRLDERVAEIIPEFATNGKDVITVEQLMLHQGGFPYAPLGPGKWETKQGRLDAFARWRLNWEPGSRFEYHASAAHWVMAEIIERRTGVEWKMYLRQRIIEPMGLDGLYVGLPEELNARVADVMYAVPPVPPPGGWGEVTPNAILNFNHPEVRAVGNPGGGGFARAADLALFYQPLLNGGVTATGTRYRDPMFNIPVNRGLSVVVAGDDGLKEQRGFGSNTSAKAFGHAGAGGQIAWGDPESGISLGYVTNGFDAMEAIRDRTKEVSDLAAVCAAE